MKQINASGLKAACLRLQERVRQIGEQISVLKNGESLAIAHAAFPPTRKSAFGALKHTLRAPLGDLVEPLEGITPEREG